MNEKAPIRIGGTLSIKVSPGDEEFAQDFNDAMVVTGKSKSELGKRAVWEGLGAAIIAYTQGRETLKGQLLARYGQHMKQAQASSSASGTGSKHPVSAVLPGEAASSGRTANSKSKRSNSGSKPRTGSKKGSSPHI